MAKFMIILHQPPNTFVSLSPEEAKKTFEKYQAWGNRLREGAKFLASEKLKEEGGKILAMQKGRVSTVDGPYSEAKELVGGYFTVRANSYDEVIELVRDCPHLGVGRIEIRQTDPTGCGGD